jgi:hypothetical protein
VYPADCLQEAREKTLQHRKKLEQGHNPRVIYPYRQLRAAKVRAFLDFTVNALKESGPIHA